MSRGRGRSKKTLEIINKNLNTINLKMILSFYKTQWWQKMHVANPK